jgi:hypothetical protein
MTKTFLTYLFVSLSVIVWGQVPSNNTCATASTLTYNGACVNGTSSLADIASDGITAEPACWAGGAADWNESVWYRVTLPAGQTTLAISVLAGTLANNNTGMLIYSGTCGALVQQACVLGSGFISATGLTAGGTYFIMLDGVGGNDGDFCISAGPTPTNDTRCTATAITVGAGCLNGSNAGSTDGGDPDPSCLNGPANTENSVWYSFVATDDSITINFGDGTLQTSLIAAVYNSSTGACGGAFTEIGCTNNGGEIELTPLIIGRTYFIQVDGRTSDMGTFCISAYETPPPPPPIGTCSNPRDLFLAGDCNNISGRQYDEQNNLLSTNTATGNDGGASMAGTQYLNSVEQGCTGSDVGQQGYWVRFTATSSSINVANYGGAGYDYSLFTGTPTNLTCTAGLTPAGCLSVAASDLTGNTLSTTSGRTYYMLITPSGTGTATTAFACLTASTSFAPANNNCTSATQLQFGQGYSLTTANATVDNNNTLCSGSTENNIWVYYQATYTGTAYVFLQDQDCACANGTQMSIYNASTGCPNNSSTCSIYINPNNDNDFSGQFNVVNGNRYYIQLDGYAGCACSFNLCINSINSADCSVLLLPLSLSSSTAKCNDGKVKINWTTESENNTKEFEIESSLDGIEFNKIGSVTAAGYSDTELVYEFIDINPYSNYSYYRIKQIDLNNEVFLSNIMSVTCESKTETFSIYPNPGNGIFHFNSLNKGKLTVYNSLGEIAYVKNCQEGQSELNLGHLEDGIYYFRLDGHSGSNLKKIIIRR